MITVTSVSRRFSERSAVENISFSLSSGSVTGLIGPNGAGKSTTMNMITGSLVPNEGTILIDGLDSIEHPLQARALVGYLPEQPPLYGEFTVREHLSQICAFRGLRREQRRAEVDRLIELTDIGEVASRLCRSLSKGFRQRAGLAAALAGDPPYLVLDEPAAGLDPVQLRTFKTLISSLRQDHGILLSSHILSQLDEVCDSLIIMDQGRLVISGTREEIGRSHAQHLIVDVLLGIPYQRWTSTSGRIPNVTVHERSEGIERGTTRLRCSSPTEDVRYRLFEYCRENSIPLLLIRPIEGTLEELFFRTTGSIQEER